MSIYISPFFLTVPSTVLMLNKHLLGTVFIDFQEKLRSHNTSLERIRGMLQWADTTYKASMYAQQWAPHTLPGSPHSLSLCLLRRFPLCLYDLSLSLSTCFRATITTIHFLLLCYHCHTECAQTDSSNNNFSPLLNKD